MATQAQKERQITALSKKAKQEGLSNQETVEKLQPIASQEAGPNQSYKSVDAAQVDPTGVEAIGVAAPDIQAANQPSSDPMLPTMGEETVEPITPAITPAVNMESPTQISKGIQEGYVSMQQYKELATTNPALYQAVGRESERLDIYNRLNDVSENYQDRMDRVTQLYAEQSTGLGGMEAVETLRQFMPENKYEGQMNSIAEQIAQIDNANRTVVEDTIRETGNSDYSYVLAKSREKKQIMMEERTLLVAEYSTLQSHYEQQMQKASMEYGVYQQGEQAKQAHQDKMLQYEYNMTAADYENQMGVLELALGELDKQEGYAREDARRQQEQDAEDRRFMMSEASGENKFQREFSAKEYLNEKDFENKVAFLGISAELDVKQQAAILKQQYDFEQQYGDSTELVKTDNGVFVYDNKTGEFKQLYNPSAQQAAPQGTSSQRQLKDGEVCDYQCGGYARRLAGIDGTPGGNDLSARKGEFDAQSPQAGGLVLFAGGNYDKTYGHVAFVESINGDGTITIKESNLKGDMKVGTRTIPLEGSSIHGFYNDVPVQEGSEETPGYNEGLGPMYASYLDGGLSSAELNALSDVGLTVNDIGEQALAYKKEVGDKKAQEWGKSLIQELQELKQIDPGRVYRMGSQTGVTRALDFSGGAADFNAKLKKVIASASLDNLLALKESGATFGALSDTELQFITSSATALSPDMSNEEFTATIDKLIQATSARVGIKEGSVVSGYVTEAGATKSVSPFGMFEESQNIESYIQ